MKAVTRSILWNGFSVRARSGGRCVESVQQLISLILTLLSAFAMLPAPAFPQSGGSPSLALSVVAEASPTPGVWALDVQITNNGTGAARNIVLQNLQLRTLTGSGAVTYDASLSPAFPLSVGDLAAGGSAVIRLSFDAPATVLRFSVTENGTLQD